MRYVLAIALVVLLVGCGERKPMEAQKKDVLPLVDPIPLSSLYIKRVSETEYRVYQQPKGSRWFEYRIKRTTAQNMKLDLWHLYRLSACDLDTKTLIASNTLELTVDGAWEHALSPKGEDWMGSWAHGHEMLTNAVFNVDGLPSEMKVGEVKAGISCGLSQKSNLFKSVGETLLAEDNLGYKFTPENLVLNDELTWKQNTDINTMFWPMAPFKRHPDVTSVGKLFGEAVEQDISVPGFKEVRKDTNGARLWNKNNKLTMEMEVLNPQEALDSFKNTGGEKTWITNSALYNKLYFTRIGKTTHVKAGEVIRLNAKFTAIWPK